MYELDFDARVQRALFERYWPLGVCDNNKTGYRGSHHAPLGGPGGEDLVFRLDGLYIAIECKSENGALSEDQKTRRENVERSGCLYVVCQECGFSGVRSFDAGFDKLCAVIDGHYIKKLGSKAFKAMRAKALRREVTAKQRRFTNG